MRNKFGEARPVARILVLLLAAAAAWFVLRGPALEDRSGLPAEAAGRSPLPGSVANPTVGAGTSELLDPVVNPRAALAASTSPTSASEINVPNPAANGGDTRRVGPGGPARSRSIRAGSPLTRSPGYVPPPDPESLSVLAGRRDAPPVDRELAGGSTSLQDLAQKLLAALRARDEGALHARRVSRPEFEIICWPEFPESRPITNITAADAWGLGDARSLAGASRAVAQYGGRDLELLEVRTADVFPYRNFLRHREVVLSVRDRGTGELMELGFAPSAIERHGRFKALLYRD